MPSATGSSSSTTAGEQSTGGGRDSSSGEAADSSTGDVLGTTGIDSTGGVPAQWMFVDLVAEAGSWDIAADSAGDVHVVYFRDQAPPIRELVHVLLSNGRAPETEVLLSDANGHAARIAVDDANGLHILHRNAMELRYTYVAAAGNPTTETVQVPLANDHDLVVDALGAVHAVVEGGQASITYLSRPAPTDPWTMLTVEQMGSFRNIAIGLSPDGTVHTTYVSTSGGNDSLRHATIDGPQVSLAMIDEDNTIDPLWSAIATDDSNAIHVAYVTKPPEAMGAAKGIPITLRYAYALPGEAFTTQIVDDLPHGFSAPSIAVEPMGVAHITYFDGPNEDLKYATGTADAGFATESVDTRGDVGAGPRLAIDPFGGLHEIHSSGNTGLRYGYLPPT